MLTDAEVKAARPAAKPYKLGDAQGLYLLVTTSGGKAWRMNYTFGGRQRTVSFGLYPDVSLAKARERRQDARKLLSEGQDPSGHKRAVKAAQIAAQAATFKALAAEYIAKAEKQGYVPNTMARTRWILNDIVVPKIGTRPIGELKPSEILAVLSAVEASGRLETARRARQLIGQVFRLAALSDRVAADPTYLLRRQIRAPQVEHHPAVIREDEFGALLKAIERYKRPVVRLALQFQALTFVRPVELRWMTWEEVSLEDNVWTIPESRMKSRREHLVPLCAATRRILHEVKALYPDRPRSGYIFPAPRTWKRPLSDGTLNKALDSLGYARRHTSHGFRASASSILNERGYRSDVIEAQLSHIDENEVRRSYNRAIHWNARVELMQAWAKIVEELRGPPPAKTRKRAHAHLV